MKEGILKPNTIVKWGQLIFSGYITASLASLPSSFSKPIEVSTPPKPKTMQAREVSVSGMNYLACPYPPNNYSMIQNRIPTFQFQRISNQSHGHKLPHEFSPQSSCLSSNSTSDEAEEQQLSLINERKHRRMISNRESARRSRMRKQKHLDELWSQVVWLRNENHQLIDKLNHVSESHEQVLQENAQLKEEASELRQVIRDMQIHSPSPSFSPFEHHLPSTSPSINNNNNLHLLS
ncbi:Basic leucine zipper 43, partial [Mucuna pruriens]